MPEGPEIRVITEWLIKVLEGRYFRSVFYNEKSKYRNDGIKNHDLLHSYLPSRISNISCKGKLIVISLECGLYITSQLGTEGKWSTQSFNHSDLWIEYGDYSGIFFITNTLYFDDSRHQGHFNIYMSYEELLNDKLKNFGIDLLALSIGSLNYYVNPNISYDDAYNKWYYELKNPRISKKQIWDFLLNDQKRFCGIGNYLQSEILYASGIKHERSLDSLSDQDISNLFYYAVNIMYESYQSRGLTIKSYWDPEGKPGTFQKKVYKQEYDPYGRKVHSIKLKGGRTGYWVPEAQF